MKSIAYKQNSGKVPGDIIIGETNNDGLTRELPKDSGKKCHARVVRETSQIAGLQEPGRHTAVISGVAQ